MTITGALQCVQQNAHTGNFIAISPDSLHKCLIFYLVQDVFVEVRHVAMIGHWPLIIILEVLLQSNGVMWNVQHRVEVVGEHL